MYAAEVTATLVDRLEDYFRIPYPFEKLDSVAGPQLFGAMEKAGLINYDQTWLLSNPAPGTTQRQRRYAMVASHGLAHQWIGNSVTMKWWDDIWLNEAFATWTASKIIAEWKPESGSKSDARRQRPCGSLATTARWTIAFRARPVAWPPLRQRPAGHCAR